LWVIFALLDPDPDSEYGSGSTDPIEYGSGSGSGSGSTTLDFTKKVNLVDNKLALIIKGFSLRYQNAEVQAFRENHPFRIMYLTIS
jgi:hypothetical protein